MEEFLGSDKSSYDELFEEILKGIDGSPVPNVGSSTLLAHSDLLLDFPVPNADELYPSILNNDDQASTAPNENHNNMFCDAAFTALPPTPPIATLQQQNISGGLETTTITFIDLTSCGANIETQPAVSNEVEGGSSITENMMIDQMDGNANNGQGATAETGENQETEKVLQSNTKAKRQRRGKTTFLYQNKDKSNWKVQRAEKQRGYRVKQKEKDEQRVQQIAALQTEVKTLQKKLEENKGIPIASREQTVKMIDCFRKAVSQLPNNCQIVVPQQIAEMRGTLMTEAEMEKIRRDLEQVEQVPEPSLSVQTTALVHFS